MRNRMTTTMLKLVVSSTAVLATAPSALHAGITACGQPQFTWGEVSSAMIQACNPPEMALVQIVEDDETLLDFRGPAPADHYYFETLSCSPSSCRQIPQSQPWWWAPVLIVGL